MSYYDFNGFRIESHPRQLVSFATLLDARGNFAKPEVILECDGENHANRICDAIDEWWAEHADEMAENERAA